MSPTAIRFLKSAFLVATDGLAGLQEFAGNATGLYYTTDEAHEGSTAFLEDHIGRKKVILGGIVVSILASFGCLFAPTIQFLIAARFLQGIGMERCCIRLLEPSLQICLPGQL